MNPDELTEKKAERICLLERMYFEGHEEPAKDVFDKHVRAQFDGGAVRNVLCIVALLEAVLHSQSAMVMNDGTINDEALNAFRGYAHSAFTAAVDLAILLGQIPSFGDAKENDQAYARLKMVQEIENIENA